MKWIQKATITGIAFALLLFSADLVHAQTDLSLRVEVNETLANSQSINIQSLIANDGEGPNLFRIYLNNENSSEYANDLYFEILVSSNKFGPILEARQKSGQPFSLNPGQQVYATNNNIANGLPGVEEYIQFTGGLTSEGQDFVNNLEGGTTLPADRYMVEINIYQGSGLQNKVASDMAEVGTSISEDTQDLYLLSPGNTADSDASISNPYPNFQWQGSSGSSFRLLVVEGKDNESPQSLLDGAQSTSPTQANGMSSGGSLVDYEMLDRTMSQSSFQYPNSGVQSLEEGKTYYWRIIAQRETSSGEELRESEIWSFTLSETQSKGTTTSAGGVSDALKSVLGEQFNEFSEQGYTFDGMIIDGQVVQGAQAMQKLRELSRRAENGEVSIIIEKK